MTGEGHPGPLANIRIPRALLPAPLLKEQFTLSNVPARKVRVIGAGRLAMAVAGELAVLGLEISSGDVPGSAAGSDGAAIAISALESRPRT